MATEEVPAPVIKEPIADLAPADHTGETEVPTASKDEKAKKSNPKKPRKPRAPASHPPYIEMIQEAIASLKERTGSSQYAITKFIEDKHKDRIPPNFKKLLLFHLRKLTAAGKLHKVKNSYKIPAAAAKPKAKPAVKPKAKPVVSAKPKAKAVAAKPKTKSVAKLKAVAKVAKPKPKTVAAKSATARPAKAAKSSEKDAPGKKKVVPAAKKVPAKKALEKVKKGKPAAKVAAKKTPARKAKKY